VFRQSSNSVSAKDLLMARVLGVKENKQQMTWLKFKSEKKGYKSNVAKFLC